MVIAWEWYLVFITYKEEVFWLYRPGIVSIDDVASDLGRITANLG
jgi:hypothetical protein